MVALASFPRWTVRRFGAGELIDLPALGVQLAVDAGVAVD
jgi:hypothetical protein